jgi:hypothetical protein
MTHRRYYIRPDDVILSYLDGGYTQAAQTLKVEKPTARRRVKAILRALNIDPTLPKDELRKRLHDLT